MGNYNSSPSSIPSADEARRLAEAKKVQEYEVVFRKCSRNINKAIQAEEDWTFCEYVGPKYTKILNDQGYDTKWHTDDDWYSGPRYKVSWKKE